MSIKHREQCADSCPDCGIDTFTRYEVDLLLRNQRTALLAKLRDEVVGLRTWHIDAEGVWVSHKEKPGVFLSRPEILSLLTEIEGEMK